MAKKTKNFEQAMARLEEIAQLLASQEATLDGSLQLYSEATELIAYCNEQLNKAQLQIQTISSTVTAQGKE